MLTQDEILIDHNIDDGTVADGISLNFSRKNSQRHFVVIFMIAVYGKGDLADTYFYDIKQFPIASLVGGFFSPPQRRTLSQVFRNALKQKMRKETKFFFTSKPHIIRPMTLHIGRSKMYFSRSSLKGNWFSLCTRFFHVRDIPITMMCPIKKIDTSQAKSRK